MNFDEILENNRINIFPTISQKILFCQKNLVLRILFYLPKYFLIFKCLTPEQKKKFENIVQNIDNPVF